MNDNMASSALTLGWLLFGVGVITIFSPAGVNRTEVYTFLIAALLLLILSIMYLIFMALVRIRDAVEQASERRQR
jgi:hypothetical protein